MQLDGSELPFFVSNVLPNEVDPNQLYFYSAWKGKIVMTLDDALAIAENCGLFVIEQIQVLLTFLTDGGSFNLKLDTQVLSGIAFMLVELVCGIYGIEAERDSANRAAGSYSLSSTVVPPPATTCFLQDLGTRVF